jgi:acyl-CoA synthetase (AMP-forming)/AMP-acid ligase II/3-hydroxymyristoyl/3-hydroxydecanoyl-(acyl carrier protein) dehydratase
MVPCDAVPGELMPSDLLSSLGRSDYSPPWVDRDGETQLDLVAHARRIAALLDGCRGRVVLSCGHARSYVPGLLGAWLAGATVELLPNVQPGTLDRVDADEDVAYVLHDVAARQERSPKAIYVPDALANARDRTGAAEPRPTAWPEIAVRMTTSGTTERPKYVTKSMAQLIGEIDVLAVVFPGARCVLSTVPLSHFYGLIFGVLLPLRLGARIVSHEALLPADIAAIVERESVDLLISTPAHLRAMAAAAMPRGLRVISSAARMPPDLHMRLATDHGWHVTDLLGSTETGVIATRDHPMNPWTALPGVKLSAPDDRLVVESSWCDGSRVELDDRVELRQGGTFEYLGRSGELVKIAGKRAHAHAIEATVLAVPGVTDVALVVHAAVGKEPRVALAVGVATDGPAVGRDEITGVIRQQFDAVFVPKIIKIVPRIPRTERGKLDTAALRDLLGLDDTPATHHVPVRRVGPAQYLAEIPHDLVFFRGHFDGFAILPGAVLIERVVWPVVKAEFPEIKALRGIRRLRFRRPVFPDQQLSVTVKHDQGRLTFEVSCAASVVASGQLLVD